ncbi:hypothetical protein Bbelb_096820 [Branchiostoma belcheri]|nr:hypothetical protein Bbelb_096820 [Branchiostoma belcheri]
MAEPTEPFLSAVKHRSVHTVLGHSDLILGGTRVNVLGETPSCFPSGSPGCTREGLFFTRPAEIHGEGVHSTEEPLSGLNIRQGHFAVGRQKLWEQKGTLAAKLSAIRNRLEEKQGGKKKEGRRRTVRVELTRKEKGRKRVDHVGGVPGGMAPERAPLLRQESPQTAVMFVTLIFALSGVHISICLQINARALVTIS